MDNPFKDNTHNMSNISDLSDLSYKYGGSKKNSFDYKNELGETISHPKKFSKDNEDSYVFKATVVEFKQIKENF